MNTTKSSFTINDIHWLPAEHMLHLGLVKRAKEGVHVLSRHEVKRDIAEQGNICFSLMNKAGMINNDIVPDFLFIDKRSVAHIALCVFLLPDERWGVEHHKITTKLKLIDKYDVNFLLVKQRANYSDGRMDSIIRELDSILINSDKRKDTELEEGS